MKKIYTTSFALQMVIYESKPIYCIKIKRIRMTCEITQLFCGGFSESAFWNLCIRFIAIDRGGQLKNQKLENQKNPKRTPRKRVSPDFLNS